MKIAAMLPLLVVTGVSATEFRSPLCNQHETTFFACNAAAKTIAVCGAVGKKHLQYRIGSNSRLELAAPAKNTNPEMFFSLNSQSYAESFGTYLSFQIGEHRYYVYDWLVKQFPPTGKSIAFYKKFQSLNSHAGVAVFRQEKNGEKLLQLVQCNHLDVSLKIPEELLPSSNNEYFELPSNATVAAAKTKR